jgi:twinkle protein
VIDPYNYIVKEGDTSETEWISSMLSRIRAFAQAYGLHIWFVAHPTKMMRTSDGKVPPPMGYDISGSAAWFAKADHGLTVHRPSPDLLPTTNVISWKSRFSWLGKQGSCSLSYDKNKCIYIDDSFDPFEGLTSYDPTDPDLF